MTNCDAGRKDPAACAFNGLGQRAGATSSRDQDSTTFLTGQRMELDQALDLMLEVLTADPDKTPNADPTPEQNAR